MKFRTNYKTYRNDMTQGNSLMI